MTYDLKLLRLSFSSRIRVEQRFNFTKRGILRSAVSTATILKQSSWQFGNHGIFVSRIFWRKLVGFHNTFYWPQFKHSLIKTNRKEELFVWMLSQNIIGIVSSSWLLKLKGIYASLCCMRYECQSHLLYNSRVLQFFDERNHLFFISFEIKSHEKRLNTTSTLTDFHFIPTGVLLQNDWSLEFMLLFQFFSPENTFRISDYCFTEIHLHKAFLLAVYFVGQRCCLAWNT